ncbi:polysaccharide deacetylase family protein [Anaerovibrio sp.]|uniref:polysaccharide deacetylase family protein n=1 Tax=Anaerovibrio sp. TaxID=1872532 RepID=UPI0025F1BB6E|nr:polysaccharide deacetylase family protein [Anaerovibrio sp.]
MNKKMALIATGVALLAVLLIFCGMQLLSMPDPKGIPILEYHMVQAVDPDRAYEYNVPPDEFEAQLDYLEQEGYTTISIRDFLRAKKGLQDLPDKPVILTFDDGYKTNYTELLPILEKRGLKATIFVVVNDIGKERYMSWDQLRDIQHRGVEIGSHTANHLPLGKMDKTQARDEMRLSKLLMEWNGMDTIYTLSYPNGSYSNELVAMLKEEEYLAAVTGDSGLNDFDTDPYLLHRINIPHPMFGITEFKWRLMKGKLMTRLGIFQHKS